MAERCVVPAGLRLVPDEVLLASALHSAWPVDEASCFAELLQAIDQADRTGGRVVFSLESGEVCAHWAGAEVSVKLGAVGHVIDMMRDFIAQTELGERMISGEWKDPPG